MKESGTRSESKSEIKGRVSIQLTKKKIKIKWKWISTERNFFHDYIYVLLSLLLKQLKWSFFHFLLLHSHFSLVARKYQQQLQQQHNIIYLFRCCCFFLLPFYYYPQFFPRFHRKHIGKRWMNLNELVAQKIVCFYILIVHFLAVITRIEWAKHR